MEFLKIPPPKPPELLSDFDKFIIALAHARLGVRRKIVILKKYLDIFTRLQ